MDDAPQRRFRHMAVRLDHCILVFGGKWENYEALSLRVICMYNLYTEQWRKYKMADTEQAPPARYHASATLVGSDIYLFGGRELPERNNTNALWKLTIGYHQVTSSSLRPSTSIGESERLPSGGRQWKLTRTPHNGFVWSEIKHLDNAKSPSPRDSHSAWEHAGKLWIFGGFGSEIDGYLHNHGDHNTTANNQVLCFDPIIQRWTNPVCSGAIPEPRFGHTADIIGGKVWLSGGFGTVLGDYKNLYQLDMESLIWTLVDIAENITQPSCTLTAITENQLVCHGSARRDPEECNTWIFHVTSELWTKYTMTAERYYRVGHTGSTGVNSSVIIIGGGPDEECNGNKHHRDLHIMLGPKSLQHLAIKIIHDKKNMLSWELLPEKLKSLFGFLCV